MTLQASIGCPLPGSDKRQARTLVAMCLRDMSGGAVRFPNL
jgi:hypothetical protein